MLGRRIRGKSLGDRAGDLFSARFEVTSIRTLRRRPTQSRAESPLQTSQAKAVRGPCSQGDAGVSTIERRLEKCCALKARLTHEKPENSLQPGRMPPTQDATVQIAGSSPSCRLAQSSRSASRVEYNRLLRGGLVAAFRKKVGVTAIRAKLFSELTPTFGMQALDKSKCCQQSLQT
jgi:hypothetical protein